MSAYADQFASPSRDEIAAAIGEAEHARQAVSSVVAAASACPDCGARKPDHLRTCVRASAARDATTEEDTGDVAETEPEGGPAGTDGAGAPDYLRNFATHLSARMRALGRDQARLQQETGIKTPQVTARAINGTGVDLGLAGEIARAVGSMLPVMLGEYVCSTCEGAPPAGFGCLECGTEGERL